MTRQFICPQCGRTFSRWGAYPGKYCSRKCAGIARSARRASIESRFWPKVDKTDTCWLWTGAGASGATGYGRLNTSGQDGFRWKYAHRLAWELCVGPIPEGMHVLHHCDNPPCVHADPDPAISHLFLGTISDNAQDMVAKGRGGEHGMTGEAHPMAKLTNADVLELRRLHREGIGTPELARIYGVLRKTAWLVATGRTWTHI